MRFKLYCECGNDVTDVSSYNNENGYFYITANCEKCKKETSVDMTDYLECSNFYGGDTNV